MNLEYLARVVFSEKQDGAWRRFPRFAGRHRFAHHHGQRPRRLRLGRRRHRSGSRHARPAAFDADSRRRRLQTARPPARRRHGHRPRSHRHADAAQKRRRRKIRRVLRHGTFQPHASRPRHHRQHGARIWRDDGLLPGRRETLAYLRFTARDEEQVQLVEAYTKEQGLFRTDATPDPIFSDKLELDLATVVPTMAGPKRPQDSVPLTQAKTSFEKSLTGAAPKHVSVQNNGDQFRSGRWLRRDRRDHQLHQHFESVADARRRPAREKSGRARPDHQALGENQLRARIESRHRLHRKSRPVALSRIRCVSISSATAAPPASAIAARCPNRSAKPSRTTISSPFPSSAAIAISKAASIRSAARIIWRRRRWSWPTRSRAAWISISSTSRSATTKPASPSTCAISGPRRGSGIHDAQFRHQRNVPQRIRRRFHGRRALAGAADSRRRSLRLGCEIHVHQASAVFRQHAAEARRA